MGRQARIRTERRYKPLPPMGWLESLSLFCAIILGTEKALPGGPLFKQQRRVARRKRSSIFDAIVFGGDL